MASLGGIVSIQTGYVERTGRVDVHCAVEEHHHAAHEEEAACGKNVVRWCRWVDSKGEREFLPPEQKATPISAPCQYVYSCDWECVDVDVLWVSDSHMVGILCAEGAAGLSILQSVWLDVDLKAATKRLWTASTKCEKKR